MSKQNTQKKVYKRNNLNLFITGYYFGGRLWDNGYIVKSLDAVLISFKYNRRNAYYSIEDYE